ncbi:hypothetical protein AURDEDRAFT_130249 [Auricularia subglabra TFB-10046 SS5]|nr:hypothetical protein AURDEDRAFT_130249 [Auricularia subglabra TFB-10046 SS5]
MQALSRLLSALIAAICVSASWTTDSTNASLTPFLLRSKTLSFRGISELEHPMQRRQELSAAKINRAAVAQLEALACLKDVVRSARYTCSPPTCRGFEECPTDPTLAKCASGEGCCPPGSGALCTRDSSGATQCELPASDDPSSSSTSTISRRPSSSSDLDIPATPSDDFPAFTAGPDPTLPPFDAPFPSLSHIDDNLPTIDDFNFPTISASVDDNGSNDGDNGRLGLALRSRLNVVTSLVVPVALALAL